MTAVLLAVFYGGPMCCAAVTIAPLGVRRWVVGWTLREVLAIWTLNTVSIFLVSAPSLMLFHIIASGAVLLVASSNPID